MITSCFVGLGVSQKTAVICGVDAGAKRIWRGQCTTVPGGARMKLLGMTTRMSNHIRGVLKTFGLLPGAMRGLRFDRRVEQMLIDQPDVALIVRPMLVAWRQLREQIAVFDKAARARVNADPVCRFRSVGRISD